MTATATPELKCPCCQRFDAVTGPMYAGGRHTCGICLCTWEQRKRQPAQPAGAMDGEWIGEPFRKGLSREAAMVANSFLPVDWNDQMRGHVWHAMLAYVNAMQPAVAGEGLTIPRATLQTWWNKLLANGPEANNWDTGKLLEVADAIRELLDATPSPPPADAGDARDYDARTFTLLWNECILKEVHDTKALEGIVTRFNCCLANPIYAHKPVDAGRERVRFEAWADSFGYSTEKSELNNQWYAYDTVRILWNGWCAALGVKP